MEFILFTELSYCFYLCDIINIISCSRARFFVLDVFIDFVLFFEPF
jgi:hypothetical protein